MLDYISGQGKVYTAEKDVNGNPLGFIFRGNIPAFEVSIAVDTVDHKESTSGRRLIDLRLITGQTVQLTMNCQQISPDNLALLIQGNVESLAAGSVTLEQLNGGLALIDGGIYLLKNKDVSSLVLTDSTGSPLTMATPANYVPNLPYGMVTAVGSQSGFVAPIKAAYTKKTGQKSVGMLNDAPPYLYLRFLGINTAAKTAVGAYKRFVLDLYNVQFDPTAAFGMIQDALADHELKGSVLVDPVRGETDLGGQIGAFTWIDD